MKVGQKAFFYKTVTETDVYSFAGLTGDTITTEIEFTSCVEKKSCWIAEFKGKCTNRKGEVVVEGVAHQMLTKEIFIVEE